MYKSRAPIAKFAVNQPSNCWIVKGNKNNPDRDGDIVTQMMDYIREAEDYRKKHRSKPPERNIWSQLGKPIHPRFQKGHCVFAWRARQRIGIVGIGQVIDPGAFDSIDGEHCFEWEPVQCWSPMPGTHQQDKLYITLEEIRSALKILPEEEQNPTFTKASVIQTVYPVTLSQAMVLKSLIQKKVNIKEDAKLLLENLHVPSRVRASQAERNA